MINFANTSSSIALEGVPATYQELLTLLYQLSIHSLAMATVSNQELIKPNPSYSQAQRRVGEVDT